MEKGGKQLKSELSGRTKMSSTGCWVLNMQKSIYSLLEEMGELESCPILSFFSSKVLTLSW